jgi:GMP synthase-like glutamine amidotransferase
MRIHIFQHVPFEDEGIIGDWAAEHGFPVTRTRFFAGEMAPAIDAFDWLVVMGGPMGVHDEARYPWLLAEKAAIRTALERDMPVLGICLGAQLLAEVAGGLVEKNLEREIGWFPVRLGGGTSPLLAGVPAEFPAFHWHGDRFHAPAGGLILAESYGCPAQILQVGASAIGFQFHLESTPERITALMDNCPEDMAPGAFVQTRGEIESAMAECVKSNQLMVRVLENFLED